MLAIVEPAGHRIARAARAVRAGHDVELANLRRRGRAVRLHADRPVGDAAQEQVPPLAADVGDRRRQARRQLLLHGRGVLVDLLGQRVVVGVGARLVRPVVRVVDEVRADDVRIDRIGRARSAGRQRRADALGFDRLNLILGLARADEDAEAAAQHRLRRRRVRRRDARLEVVLLRLVERRRVRIELAGVDVELDDPVVALLQRRVVVVAQPVVEREVLLRRATRPARSRRSTPA